MNFLRHDGFKKAMLVLAPLLIMGLLLAYLNGMDTSGPAADDPPGQFPASTPVATGYPSVDMGHQVANDPPTPATPPSIPFTAPPEPEIALPPQAVTVMVRDLFTDQPLAGATVALGDRLAQTDDGGQVVFRQVKEGAPLTVQAQGHAMGETVYRGEFSLEIALRPTILTGVVSDLTTGQPISSTLIYVGDLIATTDEEGAYRLEDLPPEPVLTVKASGYRKTTLQVGPGFDPHIALEPFQVKGIYIPFGLLYRPERVRELIDLVDRTELNAIVVDVKGDRARLAYASQVPLAQEIEAELPGHMDLQELLQLCRERDIYTIARLVVFKDTVLAAKRPDLAVKRPDGGLWMDRERLYWVDPFRQETWDYNIAIAKEVAEMGFDEIQVDYVRFPSDGDIRHTRYSQPSTLESRTQAIRGFFARFQEALRPLGVFTSADVFGLTVWVEEGDMGIGQRLEDVAPYVDYLCPMVYPSTFALGGLGYANPALHPYQVVYRSYQRGAARTPTRIRPWLQHFSIRGVEYTVERLLAQKQAAFDVGACGWTFWSARGAYNEEVFEVEEQDEGERLLRRHPPQTTHRPSLIP